VETADQAPTIFARELEGLLAIAAQNVRLTITPRMPGVEVDLLTDQRRHPGPTSLTVELDDLISEETRSLLLALRVPALPTEGPAVLASVTLAYMDVAGGIQAKECAQDLVLGVVPIDQAVAIQADAAVTREFLILRAARVLGAAIALDPFPAGGGSGCDGCLLRMGEPRVVEGSCVVSGYTFTVSRSTLNGLFVNRLPTHNSPPSDVGGLASDVGEISTNRQSGSGRGTVGG
jgi:hypothetical protein